MAAPRVQTLAEAMADLNPAYAASKDVVNTQISGLGAKYDAQRAGINAARGQGFNTINNQATGRGGSFSGIPVDEQATYLSTKYLPGMMQADHQQNEEGLQLKGRLADIDKEVRTTAIGRVDKQQSDLNTWNNARAAEAAQARENELNRQNQVKLSQMSISAQAARDAANKPAALTPYQAAMALIAPAAAAGKVSSNSFQLARDAYRQAGGDAGQFANEFWKYVPKDQQTGDKWKAYYYG